MKNNFNIFFDCHSFDTGWQGTTTYLAGLLNALPEAARRRAPELDVRIICAAKQEVNVRRYVHVPFDFVPVHSSFLRRNLVDIPLALRRTRADLVVSQYVRPFVSPCPTVSVIHDVLFLDHPESFSQRYIALRRLMFGWAARHSSVVSTVSSYSARRIASHFGIKPQHILIIPNAVDQIFSAKRHDIDTMVGQRPLRLLSVSRLERRKRHEWGIEAMQALSENGIDSEYTIVGGGEGVYATELRAHIALAIDNGRRVTLKSGISSEALLAEYQRSDIFLFPTEAEGFGIPLIEAAAAGSPCVVSDGGALIEFQGQFAGQSFPSGDLPAFLSAVLKVASNLDALRAEAETKRTSVAAAYSWDEVANAYVDLVLRIKGER